jgi:predicted aspartyl protease
MAGTSTTRTAQVPALRVSKLEPPTIEAPLFARVNMGAIGMLGLDALQGHAVRIDFDTNTMTLRPSRKRRLVASAGEIVVTAKSLYGQLIVTDARWHGKKIAVVLDTGSPITIANPALLRIARKPPVSLGPMPVTAVTGEVLNAQGYHLRDVEIGQVSFSDVPIAVADAAPFRKFGLQDTPALLLGMETLRLFRRVEIDFPGRSIRLTLPRSARTGSRIPL